MCLKAVRRSTTKQDDEEEATEEDEEEEAVETFSLSTFLPCFDDGGRSCNGAEAKIITCAALLKVYVDVLHQI